MKLVLALAFLMGCAQVTSLNMRKHEFGILPTKIIWFQIAGFEEEQLAMLRFQQSGERRTSFEESICFGNTWNYNLYDLRTPAQSTFLSQITGKKNIKLTCADAELRPIWQYLETTGYTTGVLEVGANASQSLTSMNSCGESGAAFISGLHLWLKQEPPKGADTFHNSQEIVIKPGIPIYDRSCSGKSCTATTYEDLRAIYSRFKNTSHKHLLIIRDFSYLDALERKDFLTARHILADLERSHAEALALAEDSSDYLVIVTTGDSRFVDMPDKGKSWYEFDKLGKNATFKRTKLTNMVLATGSRAENFCGIYEDQAVFERILSGPKQQGLEFKFINPLK